MIITLQRTSVNGEITEGRLSIDGIHICDTLENTFSCLVPGHYRVHLIKCSQYARKMPIVLSPSLSPSLSDCAACPRRTYVNQNTVMPRFCPMIKPGNGIHSRRDGSILVGRRQCHGLLVHSREVFDTLYARLRMTIQRSKEITLKIINA